MNAQKVDTEAESKQGCATCPICAAPLLPDDICATDIEMGICHAACLDGSPVVDLETGSPTAGPIDTFRYGDLDGDPAAHEDPKVTAARAAFKLFRKSARKDRKWPTTVRTAFYAGHIAAAEWAAYAARQIARSHRNECPLCGEAFKTGDVLRPRRNGPGPCHDACLTSNPDYDRATGEAIVDLPPTFIYACTPTPTDRLMGAESR